jgi:putative flippase GtrA
MKELLSLIFALKFKELFFDPTENGLIKFFRYAFVGGIAFVVDTVTYILVCQAGKSNTVTALGVAAGFVTGIITNFILSKKFVFQEKSTVASPAGEALGYVLIGLGGLGLSELLVLLATGKLSMDRYVSKIVVAVIVLVYNYFARKIILYTPRGKTEG